MATSTQDNSLVDLDFPMPPSHAPRVEAIAGPHSDACNQQPSRTKCLPFPDDFLRLCIAVPKTQNNGFMQQEQRPQQHFQAPMPYPPQPITSMPYGNYGQYTPGNRVVALGILHVTVLQAKLAKNYGLTRMDPFCRIIIGSHDRNTAVCPNGAKEPRWNQRLSIPVPEGFQSMRLEVVDVCTFSDKVVAWGDVNIERALQGESYEIWTTLSGKQGEDKEGAVNLHFQFQPAMSPSVRPQPPINPMPAPQYIGYYPGQQQSPMQPPQQSMRQAPQRPPAAADPTVLANLKEMFPDMSGEVLAALLETNNGNMDQTITSLLSMSDA